MINKTDIHRSLRSLNYKFRIAKKPQDHQFYSKLSVLEVCGWIEVSIDDIILSTAKRLIKSSSDLKKVDEAITRNWGFEYNKHVRSLLILLIGYVGVIKVEASMDSSKFTLLKVELNNLKKARNDLAHTYLSGSPTIPAPSTTFAQFNRVYEGLKELEKNTRLIKK